MELLACKLLPQQLEPSDSATLAGDNLPGDNPSGANSPRHNLSGDNPRLPGLQINFGFAAQTYRVEAAGCLLVALRSPLSVSYRGANWTIPSSQAFFFPEQKDPSPANAQVAQSAVAQANAQVAQSAVAQANARNTFAGDLLLRSDGPFLILRASEITWQVLVSELQRLGYPELQLLAGAWANGKALTRLVLNWACRARRAQLLLLEPSDLLKLGDAIRLATSEYSELSDRAPGRTSRSRFEALRRLLVARLAIQFEANASLDRLSQLADLSPSHFLKIYRTVFGQTPHRQMTERRLGRAQRLLSDGGHSVAEVSASLGFKDHAHFSKLFRHRFGIPASALVPKQQKGAAA